MAAAADRSGDEDDILRLAWFLAHDIRAAEGCTGSVEGIVLADDCRIEFVIDLREYLLAVEVLHRHPRVYFFIAQMIFFLHVFLHLFHVLAGIAGFCRKSILPGKLIELLLLAIQHLAQLRKGIVCVSQHVIGRIGRTVQHGRECGRRRFRLGFLTASRGQGNRFLICGLAVLPFLEDFPHQPGFLFVFCLPAHICSLTAGTFFAHCLLNIIVCGHAVFPEHGFQG